MAFVLAQCSNAEMHNRHYWDDGDYKYLCRGVVISGAKDSWT